MRHRPIVLATVAALVSTASIPRVARAIDKEACVAASDAAQKHRAGKKLVAARKELLVCAQDECPAVVKKDCADWLADVDASLPTVVVAAKDAASGGDLVDVRVLIDGELLAERIDGAALPVDPGPHTIRFEPKTGKAVEQQIVVKEGERNRLVSVTLGEPAPAPDPAPAPAPAPAPDVTRDVPPAVQGTPTAAWILGGVGVAALGSFAYFGLTGRSDVKELRDTCAPDCAKSDEDAARNKLLIADVSLAVSVVSLGIATYMFLTTPSAPTKSTTSAKATFRIDAAPVLGGGVAFLGGSF